MPNRPGDGGYAKLQTSLEVGVLRFGVKIRDVGPRAGSRVYCSALSTSNDTIELPAYNSKKRLNVELRDLILEGITS